MIFTLFFCLHLTRMIDTQLYHERIGIFGQKYQVNKSLGRNKKKFESISLKGEHHCYVTIEPVKTVFLSLFQH